jgi:hypothetical protein
MNPLTELLEVIRPPKRPFHAEGDWDSVESQLGLRLPSDYKAYIAAYGGGTINGGLEIPSPFRAGEGVRRWWTGWAEFYPDIADSVDTPYPVFPQSGGLLPFGSFGDVNFLNWLTVGEPEQWPFVYYHREDGFFEIKGLSSVEFVLEVVTRRSPLLLQLDGVAGLEPPCDFEAHTANPRRIDFIHPQSVTLPSLVERLTRHWLADEIRVRYKLPTVRLLIDALDGNVSLSQDCGDDRTACCVHYDQSRVAEAEKITSDLLAAGFAEISRC